jgi:hypothetical protein
MVFAPVAPVVVPAQVQTATVACAERSVEIEFVPQSRVVVRSSSKELASASFLSRSLSPTCRRLREPHSFTNGGLGPEIRRHVVLRCTVSAGVRLHVNPVFDEHGKVIGTSLQVGTTSNPFRVVASAILKNKGDPYASRIYRAKRYCAVR